MALEDLDLNSPEILGELKSKGFYTEDDVNKRNKALEDNRNDVLRQLGEKKELIKSFGYEPEKLIEITKDPRFKKIADGGFDQFEQQFGSEISQRYEALKTDKMLAEQEYKQELSTYEKQIQDSQLEIQNLRIENKLGSLLNEYSGQIFPSAVKEIIADAKRDLDFDQKGRLFVMGEDGVARQNADGPMNEKHWIIEDMKNNPHRYKGASGSNNASINGKEIDTSNMSPQEKRRAGRRQQV